jgi:hypothetical protein
MFANDITLDRPTAPSDVKISGSDTHAVWLSDGKFALKYDGSAQFGESGGNFVSVDTDGKLLARNSSSSATVVLAANFNGTDNFTVAANGTITSNSGLAATSVNLQNSTTASWFQTGTSLGGSDYVWAVKNSSTNTWHGGLKTSSDLYLGGDITSDPKILLNGSNGSASFDETVTIGSGSAAPDDYGLIAYANTDTLSNKSAVYARNLGGGRNFTGDNASGSTTFEVFDSGRTVLTTSLGDKQLQLIGTEADLWLTSTGGSSTTWRILGSTGGSTHQFRIYDNTNSADRLTISSVGRVRLPGVPGVAGSNLANLQIEADGNLCTTTSIRAAKTNISPLADTSWLFDLNPVTFNWRTKTENEDGTLTWGEEADGGTQYGLIAEEVEEVKDDFCYYNNDGELSGVHYDRLVAPLLKVVQQQKEKIEALEARLDAAGL